MPARGATPSRRQQPKRSVWEELLIARAQVRALGRLLRTLGPGTQLRDEASDPRFIALAVQNRGGFGVLCALDGMGVVWERHSVFDSATKSITDEWWEPLGMERRQKGGG